jgi:hypothetical protein
MSDIKTPLVISAHAADSVWRCGGAIALHASKGCEVTVVCLSFGERGESARLWKEPDMALEKVKALRRAEAEKAAEALGVHDLQCFDLGDYPLHLNQDDKYRLVDAIECMEGQEHLWEYYTRVAENRAKHFMRNSGGQGGGRKAKCAEGLQSISPRTVDEL